MGCCLSVDQQPQRRPCHKVLRPKTSEDFGVEGVFDAIRVLGNGGTGETWLCKRLSTNELVAIKFVPRPLPRVLLPMLFHEIKIQGDLGIGHLNIVMANEVVLTRTHLGLVMEYIAGGTMTEYVSARVSSAAERNGLLLDEDEARYFFKQFIAAVEYCHAHRVAHRDLKMDNTLIDTRNPPRVKLCDFGFAKGLAHDSLMFTHIGTPVYMSPQLLRSTNDSNSGYDGVKTDVWASGIMLFVMLLGLFPFEHVTHTNPNSAGAQQEVMDQQCLMPSWQEIPRIADKLRTLTPGCRDLLDKIFDLDESRRATVDDIKQHPWFCSALPQEMQASLDQLAAEQAIIDDRVARGLYKSKQRDKEIRSLLELSTQDPKEEGGLDRISIGLNPMFAGPRSAVRRVSLGEVLAEPQSPPPTSFEALQQLMRTVMTEEEMTASGSFVLPPAAAMNVRHDYLGIAATTTAAADTAAAGANSAPAAATASGDTAATAAPRHVQQVEVKAARPSRTAHATTPPPAAAEHSAPESWSAESWAAAPLAVAEPSGGGTAAGEAQARTRRSDTAAAASSCPQPPPAVVVQVRTQFQQALLKHQIDAQATAVPGAARDGQLIPTGLRSAAS